MCVCVRRACGGACFRPILRIGMAFFFLQLSVFWSRWCLTPQVWEIPKLGVVLHLVCLCTPLPLA